MEVPGLGIESELELPASAQPQEASIGNATTLPKGGESEICVGEHLRLPGGRFGFSHFPCI